MDFKRIKKEYKGCFELHFTESTDSSNSDLKRDAAFLADGTVLFAGSQASGRGRFGRAFFSYDGGVYMSVLLKTGIPCENALSFTTAAAVAVCRALECAGSGRAEIKWVNDVYLNGRKVCGILTEAVTDPAKGEVSVIVGIGVNLFAPERFPDEIAGRAGCAFETKNAETEARFILKLLYELERLFDGVKNHAPVHIAEYSERSFVVGRTVTVIKNGERRSALVTGITEHCALEVRYDSGEKATLLSGEISIEA